MTIATAKPNTRCPRLMPAVADAGFAASRQVMPPAAAFLFSGGRVGFSSFSYPAPPDCNRRRNAAAAETFSGPGDVFGADLLSPACRAGVLPATNSISPAGRLAGCFLGLVGHGTAGPGKARCGAADKAWPAEAWSGGTSFGKAWLGLADGASYGRAGQGAVRQGKAGPDKARRGMADTVRQGSAWLGVAWQG